MALIQDYSADRFRNICAPHISCGEFKSRNAHSIIDQHIGELFNKHQVEADMSLELVHRHCDLADNQRLVSVGRVMAPWSTTLMDVVKPSLGKICAQAVFVHDGKYYPYEFVHLSPTEAAKLPDNEEDGFGRYSDFMKEFATVVWREGINDIIGLRLLTAEEKEQAADPNVREYEINDDGGAMITLAADHEFDDFNSFIHVSWMFTNGVRRVKTACLEGTNHKPPCSSCPPNC